ncbi:MAG: hypothetical protein S4CHLAM7_10670 [Chlamydiae bacterium]|nr:hypothetical protein [Chlamydiota bacterium]
MLLRFLVFFILCSLSILFSEDLPFPDLRTPQEISNYFPKTASEMKKCKIEALHRANLALEEIKKGFSKEISSDRTIFKLDRLLGYLTIQISRAEALTLVSPDKDLREEASKAQLAFQNSLDNLFSNEHELYLQIKKISTQNSLNFNSQQNYLIQQILIKFEASGQSLSENKRIEILNLQKTIAELEQTFQKNIQEDNRSFFVNEAELEGLKEAQLNMLTKNTEGQYQITCDYPTFYAVMTSCKNSKTRKSLSHLFSNRAHPNNTKILTEIIEKSDQMARLLEYKSYAHLVLSNEMIKDPKKAHSFLQKLWLKSGDKETLEFKALANELPDNIQLTQEGKLNSWDFSYTFNQYKKKNFQIDNEEIAEYFPLEKTFQGLMQIYEQFFSIHIENENINNLWDNDVKLLKVSDSDNSLLGYILLDLFPRENKYSHACDVPGIALGLKDKFKTTPAVDLVIANFTKPTASSPSLLKHSEVNTLFHEFGHALHDLFSQNELASFSGIASPFIKIDFVELPSQMLEQWLWDPDILKKISSHYQTNKPLPDALIEKLILSKNIASGTNLQSQCYLSFLSLSYFSEGSQKNVSQIARDLKYHLCPHYQSLEEDNTHLSFGHLVGYGPRYYGYLWSKVLALDIFSVIKEKGLLNPEIGNYYRKTVLDKGACADPNELINSFLEREPSENAFLKDLGL